MNKIERPPTTDVPAHEYRPITGPCKTPRDRSRNAGRAHPGSWYRACSPAPSASASGGTSRLHAQVMATAEQRARLRAERAHRGGARERQHQVGELARHHEAFAQANIYARASGYISKRNVDIGSRVKAGDLLVEITAPELDHQIAQAEGTLAQLQATLQQAKAQRDLAQVTWDRDNPLVQKGWVTPQQGDTDRLTLQSQNGGGARSRKPTSRHRNAQLRVLNQQKAYQSVVAPFNGVITQRNIDIGSARAGGRNQRHVPVHPDAERRDPHPALRPAG